MQNVDKKFEEEAKRKEWQIKTQQKAAKLHTKKQTRGYTTHFFDPIFYRAKRGRNEKKMVGNKCQPMKVLFE